mgnify:FL=1
MSKSVEEVIQGTVGRRYAVIDVGSNSIRLVVYEALKRSLNVVFNEKISCGLGSDLSRTGRLSVKGVEQALSNLARFSDLIEAMDVGLVDAVATAAVREASDGNFFVEQVKREVGMDLRVLTGVEEAKYTALGVISSVRSATGLIADLGGGSLELAEVRGDVVGKTATLPFGSLRFLGNEKVGTKDKLADLAVKLEKLDWLAGHKGQEIFLVGGTWRSLARLHMFQNKYPLQIVHKYSLSYKEVVAFSKLLSVQSYASLAPISQISTRRLKLLPLSAQILSIILDQIRPSRIVFVASGLREGLAFSRLSIEEQNRDPLIMVCMDIAGRAARFPGHGKELADWLAPLFPRETEEEARLRYATCLLCDIAWSVHPGYRPEYALMECALMQAPMDHFGRVFLGLATMTRYSGRRVPKFAGQIQPLIDRGSLGRARAIGLAARVGETLSGGVPGALSGSSLAINEKEVTLSYSEKSSALIGHVVRERYTALAKHLRLKPRYILK